MNNNNTFMQIGFLYKKATQGLNYFATKEKNGCINKMKALKLIWLSDRYHLRNYGRLIFNDTYFALKNGAVASATKDLAYNSASYLETEEETYRNKFLVNMGQFDFKTIQTPELIVFSKSEIMAMDLIYDNFGHLDHFELSDLSHQYPEWSKFKSNFENTQSTSRFEMDYVDFFKNPSTDNHSLFQESIEFLELSKESFNGVF